MAARLIFRSFSSKISEIPITKNAIGGRNLVEAVAVTDDGSTIVAWHPDKPYPYEFSRPIPAQQIRDSGSIIKEQCLTTAIRAFKDKKPEVVVQELASMTHTTKHRWYPRSRDKRAKKTPMDRPYL